jgi:hypothetical protein
MIAKRCKVPRGGGSAAACLSYVFAEEMSAAVDHGGEWDAQITEGQYQDQSKLVAEARLRPDFGAGAIWSPASGGGKRPSSIYVRGVGSFETAAMDFEAVARTQPRCGSPVQHYVISLDLDETKVISDETLIRAAEYVIDRTGFSGHQAAFAVHRDTKQLHCHVAVSSVHGQKLRTWNRDSDYTRLSHACREAEIKYNLKMDNGYFQIIDRYLPTERIEKTPLATKQGWKREDFAEMLEDQAINFVEHDGLESPEHRMDQMTYEIAEYLKRTHARAELPLRADIHSIAARLCIRLETDKQGHFNARLMEKAPEGVVARESVDAHGDQEQRLQKWTPTDKLFTLDVKDLAPLPFDNTPAGFSPSNRHVEACKAMMRGRELLSRLGDSALAEKEVFGVLKADPGRIMRDRHASGHATADVEAVERWLGERVRPEHITHLTQSVLATDEDLVLLSPDADTALYTTKTQQELERKIVEKVRKLANEPDPLFDPKLLAQAIREEQEAIQKVFSAEQIASFEVFGKRLGVIQGDAGSGKSTLMSVGQRYGKLTGREVVGLSTAQLAAENLGAKARIRANNTARAHALDKSGTQALVQENGICIGDEASMFGAALTLETLEKVDSLNGTLVFVGDEAQLSSIGAGDVGKLIFDTAREAGQLREQTEVFRYGGKVAWMKEAVPFGGAAIRDSDPHKVKAYFSRFEEQGHVVYHATRKEAIVARAHDVAELLKSGKEVISPCRSQKEADQVNRLVRAELGLEGKGVGIRMKRGVIEIAVGERVVFLENSPKIGVLNGNVGEVVSASYKEIKVRLDNKVAAGQIEFGKEGELQIGGKKNGKVVTFDPRLYKQFNHAYSMTIHKSQGQGAENVVAAVGWGDTAKSAHVSFTRSTGDLVIHTHLTAWVDLLGSPKALEPKDDALYFDAIVQKTGGPNTDWALSVKAAMTSESHPLMEEYRDAMRTRREAYDRDQKEILENAQAARTTAPNKTALKTIDRDQRKALRECDERHEQISFRTWVTRAKASVERMSEAASYVQAEKRTQKQTEAVKRMTEQAQAAAQTPKQVAKPTAKPTVEAPTQAPTKSRGRGR